MLARHIHQFFTDEGHSSSSVHLVNPSRAPPAGPTGDAQVAPGQMRGEDASVSRRAAPRPPSIIFILLVLLCTFTAFYLSVIEQKERHHGNRDGQT